LYRVAQESQGNAATNIIHRPILYIVKVCDAVTGFLGASFEPMKELLYMSMNKTSYDHYQGKAPCPYHENEQ
jgi:hypothetical protein